MLSLILCLSALIQTDSSQPPGFPVVDGLRIKPGSVEERAFDQEAFEIKPVQGRAPVRVEVQGRTWRFSVEAAQGRLGILALQERLEPALLRSGWVWQWAERGVARLDAKDKECWLRVKPGISGELQVTLIQRGEPMIMILQPPGQVPELPKPTEDFPYLRPWPGAKLVTCAVTQSPVATDLGEGRQGFVTVNFIEKEYELAKPPSAHEFTMVYRKALENAGWQIEGNFKGTLIQLQAVYLRNGREVQATLRLSGNAMAISVADIGAQRPKTR